MKTIYIHIGTHKTGTTAIQMFSAKNVDDLVERGLYYPLIGRPLIIGVSYGHHLFPWYIANHPVPDRYWRDSAHNKESIFSKLLMSIKESSCEKILITSEEFDVFTKKNIETLKSYFSEFNVKVIAYLRRKDSYVESMYQTMVVYNNESRQIYDVLKDGFRSPLNYFNFIENWRQIFGQENVIIRLYCPEALDFGDVVIDFYNRVGLDIRDLRNPDEEHEINSSVPLHYAAVMGMLRRAGAHPQIVKTCGRIAQKMKGKACSGFHFLPEDERQRLAQSGLQEMKQLKFLPEDDPIWRHFEFVPNQQEIFNKNKRFEGIARILMDFETILNSQQKESR